MEAQTSIAVMDFFAELPDPRQAGKVVYPLREIILVALCATICGADSFVEFEEFGKAKIQFLRKLLPFEHGIPSHDTFGAVFSNIDPKQFGELFIAWAASLQKGIPELVAIDGKTVRRSMNGEIPPIHIVSAWASEQNLVIGQIKTEEKSNEITAIPPLLSMLSLKKALVSIDAMGCQKNIAEQIILQKADYLLAVKQNQKALYDDISLVFQGIESGTFPVITEEITEVEKGHGRHETRIYSICHASELLSTGKDWKNLQIIGKVRSIRQTGEKTSDEVRYFITSRKLTVREFATAVRKHWSIENSLHWVLDIVFRDDESRVRTRHAATNFVTLKHITLNMLKGVAGKASMRVRRKRAGWDDNFLLSVLAATPAL